MEVKNIIGIILVSIFFALVVLGFILCFRYDYLFKKRRKEYIDTLNEHDKAVIFDYEKKIFVSYKEIIGKQHENK